MGRIGVEGHLERGPVAHPLAEHRQRGDEVLALGHVGAQVVQRLTDIADDGADLLAELAQRCRHVAAALGLHREPVDLEPDHGEGVADPVVQLAGDAAALLVGADRPETAEQPSVVDGDAERLDEAVEQFRVLDGEEVGLT